MRDVRNGRRWAGRGVLVSLTMMLLVVSCRGSVQMPRDITDTTAVLYAKAECLAETDTNPCTGWFQYWAHGDAEIRTTERVRANVVTGGLVDFQQTVTGLSPDTLYHVQFCGHGDKNVVQPGLCVGPAAVTKPGTRPDPANYSGAQSFRTATSGTSATVDIGRVLSTADTEENPIARDGGLSVAYSDTDALWIFGDSVQRNGPAFLALGTAAAGPFTVGSAPTRLNELPRPPSSPQSGLLHPANFFPAVEGLVTPDNPPVPCGSAGSNSYSAAWLSGAARIPGTGRLMVIWAELCVAVGEGRSWPVERWRIAEYDPASNRFVRFATPFVADPLREGLAVTMQLSNPVFGNDGYVYFFGNKDDHDTVFVARVTADPATWGNPDNYRWWGSSDGGPPQWTTEHSSVVSVTRGVTPFSIHVADYQRVGGGKKLAMMVKTSFYDSPHFQILTADSPLGPWTVAGSGRVPDSCTGGGFGCYAFYGHPELSSNDSFVFSWYSPGDRGSNGGHVRLGKVAW